MERRDNYAIQAKQAKGLFANYDARALAEKLHTRLDDAYLYTRMLGEDYRIHRGTGDISRLVEGKWIPADSFGEVMTLLDLVCDSREDRWLSGRWKNMVAFGLQFHQNLMEGGRDSFAETLEANAEAYRGAAERMGAVRFPQGDLSYTYELFDGLPITVQLWFGDDEFPSQIRYFWDENALMYIKYETMYYAVGLLKERILAQMGMA